jgi:hypothetical protein
MTYPRLQSGVELPAAGLPPMVEAAIAELAMAHDYARNASCEPWQFAVEISRLSELGLTVSDLRWLVEMGYAAHAREVTQPGDVVRKFAPCTNTAFSPSTRFLLTDAGLDLVGDNRSTPTLLKFAPRAETRDAGEGTAAASMPRWDGKASVLYFGRQVVKRYSRASRNQEIILHTFEEEGWPHRIDDPLSPSGSVDPKRRLHDTIKWLNRNHEVRLLWFFGDGTGEGIRWKTVAHGHAARSASAAIRVRRAA